MGNSFHFYAQLSFSHTEKNADLGGLKGSTQLTDSKIMVRTLPDGAFVRFVFIV